MTCRECARMDHALARLERLLKAMVKAKRIALDAALPAPAAPPRPDPLKSPAAWRSTRKSRAAKAAKNR